MRFTKPRCSRSCLGLFGKLSRRTWFHDVWTCGAKVLEYWMIFSLRIKLNFSWKFWRNWNVPLVLLERSWWAGLNGIYLVRFGFKMCEILILKWFLLLKIEINSPKNQILEGKISWGHGNTWRLTIQFKAWFPFIFGCSKNRYIHCKTMFTCWVSLFCNGFTLGPTSQTTLVTLNN
jgi:hypothetical protein